MGSGDGDDDGAEVVVVEEEAINVDDDVNLDVGHLIYHLVSCYLIHCLNYLG